MSIDLASQDHGGQVVTSSDGFYTSAAMLNRPDKGRNMGDGWETRRRREDGNDHALFKLALPGTPRLIEIDTAHFKYNASAEIALYGAAGQGMPQADSDAWLPLLSRRPLQPDTRHVFPLPVGGSPVSFVRLDAFPDGGISRVRLWGAVDPAARRTAGYRWFNALPAGQAEHVLRELGASAGLARRLTGARPLTTQTIGSLDAAILKATLDGTTDAT